MGLLGQLVHVRHDELDVLPVLHHESVHLVHAEHFDGAQVVRTSGVGTVNKSVVVCEMGNSLLLLDRPPQSKGTCEDQVTTIKLGEHLHGLPRHLNPNPKVIIDVALERLDMVGGVRPMLRRREFVYSPWG